AEIALVFLKLGTIAFGGPPAHLAMMEEEFVRRRQWITEADFLDRLATANLIPGPSSTEVAIFVGQLKRGWRGLIIAGCCFLIPALGKLGRTGVRTILLLVIAVLAAVLSLVGVGPVLVLVFAGLVSAAA